MKLSVKLLGFTFLLFLFLTSCSSDNSTDPIEEDGPTAEDFNLEIEEIKIPSKLQAAADTGSIGAISILSAIELYNSLGEYSAQVVPESSTNKLSKIIHQQTIDGVTITWETMQFTDYIELEMTYNGTRQSDGSTFNNFLKGQMIMFTDGSYCLLEMYEDNSNSIMMSIELNEEDNGDFIANFYYLGFINMTITIMPDGMVEIVDVMSDGTKWEGTLFEDGTGMYRYYNADGTVWQQDTW